MKKIVSVLLLCSLLIAPALTAAQPAVTDQVFTSIVAGVEVDLGSSGDVEFMPENYELNETSSFQEEYVWFTYNWSNFQLVFIGGPNETAEYHEITLANMEAFYESFEVVEQEITDEHSWFLADAVYDGSPMVIYYEFQLDAIGETDLLLMQFSDETTLASDLAFVQTEVTVGGAPLLPNTDAQSLSSLLGIETESTGSSTRTTRSTTTEASTPDSSGSTRSTRTTRGTDATTDTNTSETSGDTETTGTDRASRTGRLGDVVVAPQRDTSNDAADWQALGLVSATEWVSPLHGASITWDPTLWTFPGQYADAIYIEEETAYEYITLETTDGHGYMYVYVEDIDESTPLDHVDYWNSPDYAASFSREITVLDTAATTDTASVVYATTDSDGLPIISVVEATFLPDNTVTYSEINAAPEKIAEIYAQFEQGIQINGENVPLTWTVEDIATIAGN